MNFTQRLAARSGDTRAERLVFTSLRSRDLNCVTLDILTTGRSWRQTHLEVCFIWTTRVCHCVINYVGLGDRRIWRHPKLAFIGAEEVDNFDFLLLGHALSRVSLLVFLSFGDKPKQVIGLLEFVFLAHVTGLLIADAQNQISRVAAEFDTSDRVSRRCAVVELKSIVVVKDQACDSIVYRQLLSLDGSSLRHVAMILTLLAVVQLDLHKTEGSSSSFEHGLLIIDRVVDFRYESCFVKVYLVEPTFLSVVDVNQRDGRTCCVPS